MATYDVPDMIPAAIMSSSSLKGSVARDHNDELDLTAASTSRRLSKENKTNQPQDFSHSNDIEPERNSSRRVSNRNHGLKEMYDIQHRSNSRSTEPTYLRQRHSKQSSSNNSDRESESESSDSDVETRIDVDMLQRNPLKSQGQIHDMLLKLERLRTRHEKYTYQAAKTAKALQKTCRNLERTMRTMADVTFAKDFHTHSRSKSTTRKAESSDSSSSSETLVRRRPSKRRNSVSEVPPQKKLKGHSEPGPANVKVDNVRLASSDTLDLLFQIDQKEATTRYDRKPRSLLYNIATPSSSHLEKLLISTTMNGDIHMWNSKTRKIMSTVRKTDLRIDSWAEDICWATYDTLAIAVNQRDKVKEDRHLCLVNIKDNEKYQSSVQPLEEKPHHKGISTIATVNFDENSDGKASTSFVTGGFDHNLMLWEMTKVDRKSKFHAAAITPLSSKHTSGIQAIYYDKKSHKIYSGGADRKMTWLNLDASTAGGEVKFSDRINHILNNPVNPHLLMICLAGVREQMRLYDVRMPATMATVLSFGCSEPENVSRYIRPDWKPNSWIVASGNMSDHKIYIWDVRYKHITNGGPSYSWNGHHNRVFRTLFIPDNTLVSMGSDRTTLFTDFQLQTDGRVTDRA